MRLTSETTQTKYFYSYFQCLICQKAYSNYSIPDMKGHELKERFIKYDDESDLNRYSNEAQRGLQNIEQYIEMLTNYSTKLGTDQDSRTFRTKLKDKINQTSQEFETVLGCMQSMDRLKFAEYRDRETRDKISKRMMDKFSSWKDKFQVLLKKITANEKVFIDNARKSTFGRESMTGGELDDSNTRQSYFHDPQMLEVNVTQEIIEEREKDIKKIQEVMNHMNDITRKQADLVKMQGEELDVVVGHIQSSKNNTTAANKHLVQTVEQTDTTNRGNMYFCFIIAIVCAIIVLFQMAN